DSYASSKIRFISSAYINTIGSDSIWHDENYHNALVEALDSDSAIASWSFSGEGIAEIKNTIR
nr:hypothetical protein [Lachnospiraceae bacterium]